MIAAISDKHRTVWGVGRTEADARADALRWMNEKPELAKGAGQLRIASLADDVNLAVMDGDELYLHCAEIETDELMQMDLL